MLLHRQSRCGQKRSYKDVIEEPFRELKNQRKRLPWSTKRFYPVDIKNRRFDQEKQCEVVDLHYQGYSGEWDEQARPLSEIIQFPDKGLLLVEHFCKMLFSYVVAHPACYAFADKQVK